MGSGVDAIWCLLGRGLLRFAMTFLILLGGQAWLSALAEEGRGTGIFVGDRVVDAVNCGGPAHKDVNGIAFREDRLGVGTASDHGKRYLLGRVPQPDQILYQTERYHTSDFSYNLRVPEDGQYALVLKFSEVYFTQLGQKIFDVAVNDIPVLQELDIFARVGKAIAHDEIIPFSLRNGRLTIAGSTTDFNRHIRVSFLKGSADNPKVNAIYVMKGSPEEVPLLPELEGSDEEEAEEEAERDGGGGGGDEIPPGRLPGESEEEAAERRAKLSSGPKTPDPYSDEDQSQLLIPILVVVLAFFPVLFCLCKL